MELDPRSQLLLSVAVQSLVELSETVGRSVAVQSFSVAGWLDSLRVQGITV